MKKRVFCAVQYQDFESRWRKSGGVARANYVLFLQDFCDLSGVPRPYPTTDSSTQDTYVPERAVTFNDGGAGLAQQMPAVRAIIQPAAGEALSSAQVAPRFWRTKVDKVKPLLDMLVIMAQVCHIEPQDTCAA
ncbi:hypothetical protein GCM10027422_34240 [Hymenobacter arcticus]